MTVPTSYIPRKKQGVDILLNKKGEVIIRYMNQTQQVSGISQEDFATIWSYVDGKRNIQQLHELLHGNVEINFEDLQEIVNSLIGFVFEDGTVELKDSDLSRTPETSELRITSRSFSKEFDNQHLNIQRDAPSDKVYKNVTIVGGGTAGYFTALAFQKLRPDLQVTLVESSKIPVIGVGEATTPVILSFLHDVLEITPVEFYKEVMPSWKLGIKFDWAAPENYSFFNPFGINNLLEAHHFNKGLDHVTLGTSLMMAGKGLMAKKEDGSLYSLLNQVGYAYHLENRKLIAFLKKRITSSNIVWLDRTIDEVKLAENGDVESLLTDQKELLQADLFVDCTGFKSLLLGGAVKSEYISFDKSLFTDRAITGVFPDGGNPDPFTLAQTMKFGWNWNIPVNGENHRGYVFSSSHCSNDEAIREMHEQNPLIEDFKVVHFKSGRRKEFWKNNVVGIGNAYGFVEPLESTGLHMIVESVKTLINNLPIEKGHTAVQKLLNEKIGKQWDYIKWFLAIHFKYNNKLESSFWEQCQNETDVSGIQDLLDVYREIGPLTAIEENDPEILQTLVHDRIFGTHGFDYMLMGQNLPFGNQYKVKPDESMYPQKLQNWKNITKQALPNQQALQILYNNPQLLEDAV